MEGVPIESLIYVLFRVGPGFYSVDIMEWRFMDLLFRGRASFVPTKREEILIVELEERRENFWIERELQCREGERYLMRDRESDRRKYLQRNQITI